MAEQSLSDDLNEIEDDQKKDGTEDSCGVDDHGGESPGGTGGASGT